MIGVFVNFLEGGLWEGELDVCALKRVSPVLGFR